MWAASSAAILPKPEAPSVTRCTPLQASQASDKARTRSVISSHSSVRSTTWGRRRVARGAGRGRRWAEGTERGRGRARTPERKAAAAASARPRKRGAPGRLRRSQQRGEGRPTPPGRGTPHAGGGGSERKSKAGERARRRREEEEESRMGRQGEKGKGTEIGEGSRLACLRELCIDPLSPQCGCNERHRTTKVRKRPLRRAAHLEVVGPGFHVAVELGRRGLQRAQLPPRRPPREWEDVGVSWGTPPGGGGRVAGLAGFSVAALPSPGRIPSVFGE